MMTKNCGFGKRDERSEKKRSNDALKKGSASARSVRKRDFGRCRKLSAEKRRRRSAKKEEERKRKAEEESQIKQNKAATKIQAVYRGKCSRAGTASNRTNEEGDLLM